MTPKPPGDTVEGNPQLARSMESVQQALATIRFGTVAITVHEGRVVQIDVTEKHRLDH